MKRVISLLLVFVLVFSCTTAIFADTNDDYDYLAYVREMERFVGIKDETTLVFDSEAALAAGYDRDTVDNVVRHIECMNQLIAEYGGVLEDDCSVRIDVNLTKNGVTTVVTTWYGLTKVYLDSDDTSELIITMLSVYGTVSFLMNLVEVINPIVNLTGLSFMWNLYTIIYVGQAQAAASSGNGIIVNLYNDTNYNQTIVYFESQ